METTKPDNEVIARFMDEFEITSSDGTVFLKRKKGFVPKMAEYDKSWDSLHAIWDKWRRVAKGYPGYHGWVSGLKESMTMCKIRSASKQMTKAIKWYHEQSKL